MALSYNVKANVTTSNVTNTESVVGSTLFIPSGSIAIGDAIKIGIIATLPPSNPYNFNIRIGANGNSTDAAVYSANNLVPAANLFNDANNWAQTNPGQVGTSYYGGFNKANFPGLASQPEPAKFEGNILLVATGQGANLTNVSIVAVPDSSPGDVNNLLEVVKTLAGGPVLGTASFQSNVNAFVSITANIGPQLSLQFLGLKQGLANTPGAAFALNAGPNSNAIVYFTKIET